MAMGHMTPTALAAMIWASYGSVESGSGLINLALETAMGGCHTDSLTIKHAVSTWLPAL